jgi:hypothetical protein
LCFHAQAASLIVSSQRLGDESRREQAESCFTLLLGVVIGNNA